MGSVIRKYYYVGESSEVDKQIMLPTKDGSAYEGAKDLYADPALTKIVGTIHYKAIKLGNKLGVPTFKLEKTVITHEGSFNFLYIRGSYQKITVNTQATSGIFTAGIVNREYKKETALIRVRELTYISNK
jgi:hypothetical protein